MNRTYALEKTDSICDVDMVLSILRSVPGVQSAVLLEGKPRVIIGCSCDVTLEKLNAALAEKVPCRLSDEKVVTE